MKLFISILLVIFSNVSIASLTDDLNKTFTKMGFAANISPTGAYRGQEGVMAFGGSAFMRAENRSLQPFSFQVPGWGASDCSFNLHLGGYGFVDSQQFVQMARAIGASASSYLFTLALKQVVPQVMNQMEALQNMANQFNQFNTDACEAGKWLVDKAGDLLKKEGSNVCQAKGVDAGSNEFGSPFKAKEASHNPAKVKQMTKEAADDPKYKDTVIIEKNIAWHAIQNNPTLKGLTLETKYLLMSLTGTIVVTTPDDKEAPEEMVYMSKMESATSKILEGLSKATDGVEVYACAGDETTKCLNIDTKRKIRVDSDKTFYGEVRKMVKGLETKVREQQELSDAEKHFIEKIDLEIYRLVKLQTAFGKNTPMSFLEEYVELIAVEMLHQYLDNCIGDVMQSFKNNVLPREYSSKFIDMMYKAKEKIHNIKMENASRASQRREMMLRVNSMQNVLTANQSSQLMGKMNFGKNLRGM